MTRTYLEKIQNQLLEEKMELEKRIVHFTNAIKENEKFAELLDETNDPNFESFTPRMVNARNKEKIQQLQENQKELAQEKKQLENRLNSIRIQLEECKVVLQQEYEREQSSMGWEDVRERKLQILEAQEAERRSIAQNLRETTVQNIHDILHKLELSLQLLDVDTHRSRMELSDVSRQMQVILDETNEKIRSLDLFDELLLEDRPVNQSLDQEIEQLIERMQKKYFQGEEQERIFFFQSNGTMFPVKSIITISVIRILQNIVEAAIFHRDAGRISITMDYDIQESESSRQTIEEKQKKIGSEQQDTDKKQCQVILTITDNGTVTDTNSSAYILKGRKNEQIFQNIILQQTVELLSGKLDIQSDSASGTVIMIKIPCY